MVHVFITDTRRFKEVKCVKFCHKQYLKKKMKRGSSVSNVKGLGGRKFYPQCDNLDHF